MSIVVQMFYGFFARINHVIRGFDALGLAAFTVIGVEAALSRGMTATIAILMGAFTAVIGGEVELGHGVCLVGGRCCAEQAA